MAVPPCPPAASTCRQMGRGHGAVPGGDTFTPPPSRGGCEGPAKLMTPLASGGATGATLISANGFPCLLNSSLFPAGAHACRSHEPPPPPLPIPPPPTLFPPPPCSHSRSMLWSIGDRENRNRGSLSAGNTCACLVSSFGLYDCYTCAVPTRPGSVTCSPF